MFISWLFIINFDNNITNQAINPGIDINNIHFSRCPVSIKVREILHEGRIIKEWNQKLFLKNKCIALWKMTFVPCPNLSRYWKTTSPWQRAYCLPPMEINPESPVIIVISNAKVVYYKKSNWYFLFLAGKYWCIGAIIQWIAKEIYLCVLSVNDYEKEQIPGTFSSSVCISYKPLKQKCYGWYD